MGDEIAPGDVLASIETDKAVVDYEMQEEGYVAKLLFPEGTKGIEKQPYYGCKTGTIYTAKKGRKEHIV